MLIRQFFLNILLVVIVVPVAAASAVEVNGSDVAETRGSATSLDAPHEEATVQPDEEASSTAPAVMQDVLQYALSHDGKRYRRGGTSPEGGFDCSGFVRHVFDHVAGVELPHSANALSKMGSSVNKAELLPGDLVFFRRTKKHISHVGIYLGDNKFIHASSRRTGRVMVSNLNDRYWAKHYVLARHLDTL